MLSQNIIKSFSLFLIKSSPGVRGLDADKGAGDHLNVAKQGGHPNNDNLMKFNVKMMTFIYLSYFIYFIGRSPQQ